MNLGLVWGKLTVKERALTHSAILFFNHNHKNRYQVVPKHHNIEFNKIIFLKLPYVIHSVEYYRKERGTYYHDMEIIEVLLKKLKGRE